MVGGRWMKLVLKVQTETALPMVQPSAVLTNYKQRTAVLRLILNPSFPEQFPGWFHSCMRSTEQQDPLPIYTEVPTLGLNLNIIIQVVGSWGDVQRHGFIQEPCNTASSVECHSHPAIPIPSPSYPTLSWMTLYSSDCQIVLFIICLVGFDYAVLKSGEWLDPNVSEQDNGYYLSQEVSSHMWSIQNTH